CGPVDGFRLARSGFARSIAEHARIDGADRPERGIGLGTTTADPLRYVCDHGHCYNAGHRSGSTGADAESTGCARLGIALSPDLSGNRTLLCNQVTVWRCQGVFFG